MMFDLEQIDQIYLAIGKTDMRKVIGGFVTIVTLKNLI